MVGSPTHIWDKKVKDTKKALKECANNPFSSLEYEVQYYGEKLESMHNWIEFDQVTQGMVMEKR